MRIELTTSRIPIACASLLRQRPVICSRAGRSPTCPHPIEGSQPNGRLRVLVARKALEDHTGLEPDLLAYEASALPLELVALNCWRS